MCVSHIPIPTPFSNLVHVANVQVDYPDKGKKGHVVILAMSFCVADFAKIVRATGLFIP